MGAFQALKAQAAEGKIMKTIVWAFAFATVAAVAVAACLLRYEFVSGTGAVPNGYRLDRWTGTVVGFAGATGQEIAIKRPPIDPSKVVWDQPADTKLPSSK
jgi:hypothetical protein